jgi:hypothetical protein
MRQSVVKRLQPYVVLSLCLLVVSFSNAWVAPARNCCFQVPIIWEVS